MFQESSMTLEAFLSDSLPKCLQMTELVINKRVVELVTTIPITATILLTSQSDSFLNQSEPVEPVVPQAAKLGIQF